MPPLSKVTTAPDITDKVRPYVFHGWTYTKRDARHLHGDCPWCMAENKFAVTLDTGLFRCLRCGEGGDGGGGNALTFIRLLHTKSFAATHDWSELVRDRKFLDSEAPIHWGVCRNLLTDEWIVPAYDADGKMRTLYKWTIGKSGKREMHGTPGMSQWLMMADAFSNDKRDVLLYEGIWDGVAAWEAAPSDLRASANFVAIAGLGAVGKPLEVIAPLFAGHRVTLFLDSDHPKRVCTRCRKSFSTVANKSCPRCRGPLDGAASEPAGFAALKRAAKILSSCPEPPEEIRYLRWGIEGYDAALKDGHDVRDAVTVGADAKARQALLGQLVAKCFAVPKEWLGAPVPKGGDRRLAPLECTSWRKLENAWKSAMEWVPGLSRGLSSMLAAVVSTGMQGDSQLWILFLSPPGSGKSTLCEALAVSDKHVLCKSNLRNLFSGYKEDKEGTKDHSIVRLMDGKTFVIKDLDPVLKDPNRALILGQVRDLYDGNTRSHFNQGMSRDYLGIRCTMLLCGTASARELDAAEFGARFVIVSIMDAINDDQEDEILERAVHQEERNVRCEANGRPNTRMDPDKARAMQLTAGYVDWLRENAADLLAGVAPLTHEQRKKVKHMAKFVAYMRARPPQKQDEVSERELAGRVAKQLIRLATCLAVVWNRPAVDAAIMESVHQATLDTAAGKVLNVARVLRAKEHLGMSSATLANFAHMGEDRLMHLLRFLKHIGAVESFEELRQVKWRLTKRLRKLWEEVMGE